MFKTGKGRELHKYNEYNESNKSSENNEASDRSKNNNSWSRRREGGPTSMTKIKWMRYI